MINVPVLSACTLFAEGILKAEKKIITIFLLPSFFVFACATNSCKQIQHIIVFAFTVKFITFSFLKNRTLFEIVLLSRITAEKGVIHFHLLECRNTALYYLCGTVRLQRF